MAKAKVFKGKKALLVAEGCKLNKEKKGIDTRLAEIKDELSLKVAGTYTNEAGDKLVISETEKFTDIQPKSVMNYLKKNKMASRFPETVKVQITALKKLVPETVIQKWRTSLDSTLRWSWK